MSFDWGEYFDLAQELAGPLAAPPTVALPGLPASVAGREARCRSAISRAYYAAFIRARNHLRDIDLDLSIPSGGEAHYYVRDQFWNSHDRRRRKVADLLHKLRLQRNRVDYDDQIPGLFADTTTQLSFAQTILAVLDSL